MTVQVIHQTGLLPDARRRSFDVAHSRTVAEIVAEAMPGAAPSALRHVRVTIQRAGAAPRVVPQEMWRHTRPRPGCTVVLRVVPGLGYLATSVALQLSAAGAGVFVANAVGVAVYVGGLLGIAALANSLIPRPPEQEDRQKEDTFRIDSWRNQATPGDPIPLPLGQIRVAPVYAAQPYSEIVGDAQYVRALFCFGYGRLDISELKIGETPIDELSDVEIETREGADADDPVTLVHRQVIEESIGTQLRIPQAPVDDAGNPISGDRVAQPHVASSTQNATSASVILQWPNGLYKVDSDGDLGFATVTIRIRQRVPGGSWSEVDTLEYRGRQLEPFFRQYSWDLPDRGRWEIEVTNLTTTATSTEVSNRTYLAAVQSIRPEYPLNFAQPLALVAARIRASYQLNGTIDALNAVVQRHVPVWDGETWTTGLSRNPAALFVFALQGPHHPYPVGDDGIDWDAMADWFTFCADKGLHYDRDIRNRRALGELLMEIAAAGRASPRHDGEVWTVVIDRPQEVIADHITPREAWGFSTRRSYVKPPDGVRVPFRDRTNGYQPAERIIPWPGHEGEIDLVEEWPITGKTDPDELAREIYREMLVAIHRRDRFFASQEGAVRAATRGDAVAISYDILAETHACGRVVAVDGALVVLDEEIMMEAGTSYVIRFMDYSADDTVGDSIQSTVATVAGTTRSLRVTGPQVPRVGAVVIFGPAATHYERVRVLDIEPGTDFTCRIVATNDAPEIDTLTDAYVPPAWDAAVGEVVTLATPPDVPVFAGVATVAAEGSYGADARTVRVALQMPLANTIEVAGYELDHRLSSGGAWTTEELTGSSGQIDLAYDIDDEIELVARAISVGGTTGSDTDTLTYTVGSDALGLPEEIDIDSASVTGGLGVAAISVSVGDSKTDSVQIFRTADGVALDTDTDTLGDPVTVPGGGSIAVTDGDPTRADMLASGAFEDAGDWTLTGGWTITDETATHTPGSAGTLSQSVSLGVGTTYRGAVWIAGRTAGSVTVQLAGGTDVPSDTFDADGQALFSLDAVSGNDRIEIVATSDFDGSVTQVLLFPHTAASAPQGVFDYRFAAINSEGVASGVSTAIPATII